MMNEKMETRYMIKMKESRLQGKGRWKSTIQLKVLWQIFVPGKVAKRKLQLWEFVGDISSEYDYIQSLITITI